MNVSDISEATLLYLSDISSNDEIWDQKKNKARNTSRVYDLAGYEKYSKRVFDCAQSLGFSLKTDDNGGVHLRLSSARFCRVRLCPVCSWRRSLMWRGRFIRVLPGLLADHPKSQFIFLTLTVRNCPVTDLRDTLTSMNKAFVKLSQRKIFPAIGWVKSIEVTKGKDGSAHPHLHCLLMVKDSYFKRGYISQDKWSELWKDCLGVHYTPIVHVAKVRKRKSKTVNGSVNSKLTDVKSQTQKLNRPDSFDMVSQRIDDDLMTGILEVLKYSVKDSDLQSDPNWVAELTRQLHKTRSVALGGLFKQYLREDEPEDLITEESTEDVDLYDQDIVLLFDWGEVVRRYVRSGSSCSSGNT